MNQEKIRALAMFGSPYPVGCSGAAKTDRAGLSPSAGKGIDRLPLGCAVGKHRSLRLRHLGPSMFTYNARRNSL